MTIAITAVVLLALAAGVAAVLRGRRPEAVPVRTGGAVPDQLARADFVRPEAPWLVVAFSSSSCLACQGTWEKVSVLESTEVAVQEVPFQERRDLHERYAIDAVPLVLVVDADGAVRASFVGPPPTSELWAAMATLRDEP